MEVRRGDVWQADLGQAVGSEQGGVRPVIVIQNDVGNKFSPTVIAIPLTSKRKNSLPTHGTILPGASGLDEESTFLAEQILTIDKRRMMYRRGRLTPREMGRVDVALSISIHLIKSRICA